MVVVFFPFQTFGEHFAQYQALGPNQMGVEDFRSFLRLEQKVIFSELKSGQKIWLISRNSKQVMFQACVI